VSQIPPREIWAVLDSLPILLPLKHRLMVDPKSLARQINIQSYFRMFAGLLVQRSTACIQLKIEFELPERIRR